jgi:hypothetical protein
LADTRVVRPGMDDTSARGALILAAAEKRAAAAAAAAREEEARWASFRPLRLLTGPAGAGKSAILAYAVDYARNNDWIVLHVRSARDVMVGPTMPTPSVTEPGMVDQNAVAVGILGELLDSSAALLAKIPQRGTYAKWRYLPEAEDEASEAARDAARTAEAAARAELQARAEAAGESWDPASFVSKVDDESDKAVDRSTFTLADMVAWGVRHPDAASPALCDVFNELRAVTEYPVLIAVDGINEFYVRESMIGEEGTGALLPPDRLTVPNLFRCVDGGGFRPDKTLARGVWLGTVTWAADARQTMFTDAKVRGRFRVPVPPLTREEVYSALEYYRLSGAFTSLGEFPAVDAFLVEYFRMLTGGNPRDVFRASLYTDSAPPPGKVGEFGNPKLRG